MLFHNHAFATVAFSVCSLAAGSALAAAPQRTFVASYGLDTNPTCSLTAPCRGFQAAINAVAAGGEVVVLDSAGYGAMEIHKSVSVIVPPGVHAGLSPSTGIPLPGYPGQYGVVLIDIQDTDVVVLRGLNVSHQGTVTGGIEWISAHGGSVHLDDVAVNGFPKEGVYVQAPAGKLFIKNSVFRNNGVGIYGAVTGGSYVTTPGGVYGDHVHVENSGIGVRAHSGVGMKLSNCTITENGTGVYIEASSDFAKVHLDRCAIHHNANIYSLNDLGHYVWIYMSGSIVFDNSLVGTKTGTRVGIFSYGNNSGDLVFFTQIYPPT